MGTAAGEMVTGAVLVGITALGGVYFALRPGSGALDRWIQGVVTRNQSAWFTTVTSLRYPAVVVAGAAVIAATIVRCDRFRALACLLGPPLALLTGEEVAKPLVGRSIDGVLSYPSGSTVGAAALAMAAVLAATARWRVATAVVAAAYAVWMALAVVALQWHYPTDALAGLAYGAGVVLVVDGAARVVADRRRALRPGRGRVRAREEPPEPGGG
jgi:membrane-associated phospholipid phosphatase